MRTETITMTDMNQSDATHRTPLHAGSQAGEVAGKTRAVGPPGENKLSLMEES